MTVQTTQDTVTVTIDGFEIAVPKGTLVIRAAELLGIHRPTLYSKLKHHGISLK